MEPAQFDRAPSSRVVFWMAQINDCIAWLVNNQIHSNNQLNYGDNKRCYKYEFRNGSIKLISAFLEKICVDRKGEDAAKAQNERKYQTLWRMS